MAVGWRKNYERYRKYFLNVYQVYNKKPDVKMYLEIILTLGAITFFGASALRPTILTITELNEQIKKKEEIIVEMDTKIQNIRIAQGLYAQEAEAISLLDSAVPSEPQPDFVVRQFEGLANSNNSTILGMSTGEVLLVGKDDKETRKSSSLEKLPGDAKELSFTITATGDSNSLREFMQNMTNLRRPIKTDSASVNSSETGIGRVLVLAVSGRLPYIESE